MNKQSVRLVKTKNISSWRLISFGLLIFSSASSFAQGTFQKAIGAEGYEKGSVLKQLPDGGFIIGGESDKSFGKQESDMLLIRTDAAGNVIWGNTYGGPDREVINEVLPTPDRGFLFVAEKYQPDKTQGEFLTLGKTDESGNLLWKKLFDEGGNETEGFSMSATPDGAYIITGVVRNLDLVSSAFHTLRKREQSLYLLKVDGSGNKLWSKKLTASSGNIASTGVSVIVAGDGSYVVAGNVSQKEDENEISKSAENVSTDESRNLLLLKVKPDGILVWSREFKSGRITAGFSVIEKMDGGLAVTGIASVQGDNVEIFLMSLAADGSLQWAKTFGGIRFESVADLEQSSDGGFIVSGMTKSFGSGVNDALLFKTDDKGNLIWAKTYGQTGFEYATQIVLTENGIVMTGEVSSLPSESFDVLLLKTDATGNGGCFSANAALTVSEFSPSSSEFAKAVMAGVEKGIIPPGFKLADVNAISGSKRQFRSKLLCN